MNKKIIYSAMAVLLVVIAIIAYNAWESRSDNDLSQDNRIDTLEEAPIIGKEDDAPENKPDILIDPTEEPTDKVESTAKPQNETKPANITGATSADYEVFMNMPPEDQQKYVDSFPSLDAFFDWYNAAKKAYEIENPPIEVGEGVIDMGEIVKEKN